MRWWICIKSFWIDGLHQMIFKGQVFMSLEISELPVPVRNHQTGTYAEPSTYWKETTL